MFISLLLTILVSFVVGRVLQHIAWYLPKNMVYEDHLAVAEFLEQPVSPDASQVKFWSLQHNGMASPLFSFFGHDHKKKRSSFLSQFGYDAAFIFSAIEVLRVFGNTYAGIAAIVISFALITLSKVDFESMLLPNTVVIPLMGFGLYLSADGVFIESDTAVIGLVTSFAALTLFAWVMEKILKQEQIGGGDLKLIPAIFTFIPISLAASFAIISCALFLLMVAMKDAWGKASGKQTHNLNSPFPFGPSLCIAGWIMLLYGDILQKIM